MSIPKQTRSLLALLLLAPALFAQEPAEEPVVEVPEWQRKYENLTPENQQRYAEAISDAARLFNQKRIFEALNGVKDAKKIFPDNPAALNLEGACYVEFRDFAKARSFFDQALALAPDNPNVLFNLVEMDFVTQKWVDCANRIAQLMPLIPESNIPMRRLLEFKLLLTHLKTDKLDEARALAEKYDFLDDNPYYYYANAAMAYHAGDAEGAEGWIASARRVFRDDDALAPWQDTLIEYGYIKSFYGNDLEVTPLQP